VGRGFLFVWRPVPSHGTSSCSLVSFEDAIVLFGGKASDIDFGSVAVSTMHFMWHTTWYGSMVLGCIDQLTRYVGEISITCFFRTCIGTTCFNVGSMLIKCCFQKTRG
jgi:hypothetical protein